MKKPSTIIVIALLMLGIFVSAAGASSASPLLGKNDPTPCANCLAKGKLTVTAREYSSSTSGHAIAGASVSVFDINGLGIVASGTTDENGVYRVMLSPGDYLVSVTSTGYTQEDYETTVVSGKSTALTATLDKTSTVPLPCFPCLSNR